MAHKKSDPDTKPDMPLAESAPVTFVHAHIRSGPLVLDDDRTRLEIANRRVTVTDSQTISALDGRRDFEREDG